MSQGTFFQAKKPVAKEEFYKGSQAFKA